MAPSSCKSQMPATFSESLADGEAPRGCRHQQGTAGTESESSFQAQRDQPSAQPRVLSRKEGAGHWDAMEPPGPRAQDEPLRVPCREPECTNTDGSCRLLASTAPCRHRQARSQDTEGVGRPGRGGNRCLS